MLTNAATHAMLRRRSPRRTVTAQKVVIVNGSAEILDLLETVLDAGHYDVVFVESSEHAYSQIKRVQPNLVILCVRIDDAGRVPGAVDAEAGRGDPEHPGAHLHDGIRRPTENEEEVPEIAGQRDVHAEARRADELTVL